MKALAPTCFVIFGITGDLANKKLFPALFHLYKNDMLPEKFRIVGFARRDLSLADFQDLVKKSLLQKKVPVDSPQLAVFLDHLIFQRGDFDSDASYADLSKTLEKADSAFGQCSNKLFHLAVPPDLYEGIFRQLAKSGLTIPCSDGLGWTRVLVEKPFGRDVETAKKLDRLLGSLFKEEQIFRIDHYLAKETLQNILAFRFSNTIFEPLWNKEFIESVHIRLMEEEGAEGRGAFYDGVGALRDVGQNHILQMLALVAMENPGTLSAANVREKRTKVLKRIIPIAKKNFATSIVRAQYEGYLKEAGVKPDSKTETYFKIKVFLNDRRFKGVPFILESGKGLGESKAEIVIRFKKSTSCLCQDGATHSHQDVLTFRIQPDQGIEVEFCLKVPGLTLAVEPRKLTYLYQHEPNSASVPDAYEKVLYDCIRGVQTLFTSTEEIHASWKFITPILEGWKDLPLYMYREGSSEIENLPGISS